MSYTSIEYRPGKMDSVDLCKLHEQPFAAIDPGKFGAAVVRGSASPVGFMRLYHLFPPPLLALNADALDAVGLYVVEAQYLSTNVMTSLRLARSAASVVAHAAGVRSARGESTVVLWVAPSTWQAALRRRMGKLGAGVGRENGKALAMRYARQSGVAHRSAFIDAIRPVQEGMADALGISEWVVSDLWAKVSA
jgi:hypothetical protein